MEGEASPDFFGKKGAAFLALNEYWRELYPKGTGNPEET